VKSELQVGLRPDKTSWASQPPFKTGYYSWFFSSFNMKSLFDWCKFLPMEHVSSLACQCIMVVSHCLHIGKLLKRLNQSETICKHQQPKKWTKRGSHNRHLFPLFTHPFPTPSFLPFLTLATQNRGRGKLIFVTTWSTIFGVRESWCTEKLFSESWLKCTPWNVNCQNPWLCTRTLKISWRK